MLFDMFKKLRSRKPLPREASGAVMDMRTVVQQSRALQQARDFDAAGEMIDGFIARAGAALSGRARADLLMEAAFCRLRRYRLQKAAALFEQAQQAMPDHPLARQLGQYPALMQDDLPITRVAMAGTAAGKPRDRELTAVYFFLTTPTTTEEDRRGYLGLIQHSIGSLKAAVPPARAVLVTDQVTRVDDCVGFDAIVREELNSAELVHARLVALTRLLGSDHIRGDAVLLDPDTVVLKDFRGVFEAEFDLGLTLRSDFVQAAMDHEPVNVGVMFVPQSGAARARSFFELCLRHFDDIEARASFRKFYPKGLRAWRGDQVLPAAVIGWRTFVEEVLSGRTNRIKVDVSVVAFFESRLYNCSEPSAAAADGPFIMHYKGQQKARMLQEALAARS